MKRRTFLKTVGGATGVAALGGCSTPGSGESKSTTTTAGEAKSTKKASRLLATAASKPPFGKNHKQQATTGIHKKKDPDFDPTFKLSRRMPGWFPDAADPKDDEDYLFPEEIMKHDGSRPFGFSLPILGKPTPAQLLGNVLPTKANVKKPFTSMLRALADNVRKYNITLYELRRFHYLKKFGESLPKNDYGKQPELPHLSDQKFNEKAQTAEANWTAAAKALDDFIDSGVGMPADARMPLVAVEMVQVNNYIISMRVVAKQSTPDDLGLRPHVLEVGGSSSSHVSISSAFSWPEP